MSTVLAALAIWCVAVWLLTADRTVERARRGVSQLRRRQLDRLIDHAVDHEENP